MQMCLCRFSLWSQIEAALVDILYRKRKIEKLKRNAYANIIIYTYIYTLDI